MVVLNVQIYIVSELFYASCEICRFFLNTIKVTFLISIFFVLLY
jgi:hypothetical protein